MQTINVYVFNLERVHYQDPDRQIIKKKNTKNTKPSIDNSEADI